MNDTNDSGDGKNDSNDMKENGANNAVDSNDAVNSTSSDKKSTNPSSGIMLPPKYTHPPDPDLPELTSDPILTFGVIADVQYAPIPDGKSYVGVERFYRNALKCAKYAAKSFEDKGVSFALNLGDIIDGKCKSLEIDKSGGNVKKFLAEGGEEWDLKENSVIHKDDDDDMKEPAIVAINAVLRALARYQCGPMFHIYGNHELYHFDHETIKRKLKIPFVTESTGDLVAYYDSLISPTKTMDSRRQERSLRMIFIDTYDIAILGRKPKSSKYEIADHIMTVKNPNHPGNSSSPAGLVDLERRHVAFGGGVGVPQLKWLRDTLELARDAKETVIIVSHQPILPHSAQGVCLVWNYSEVMDILREFSGSIAASFSGHAHEGGYKKDEVSGIHFRVFEAALESKEPLSTFAFVDLHADRLVVKGQGDCQSGVYDLGHMEY